MSFNFNISDPPKQLDLELMLTRRFGNDENSKSGSFQALILPLRSDLFTRGSDFCCSRAKMGKYGQSLA